MRISDWSSDVCSSDLPATASAAVAATKIVIVFSIAALPSIARSDAEHVGEVDPAADGFHMLAGRPVPADRAAIIVGGLGCAIRGDRKSVVEGKSGSVSLDFGGRRNIKKKKTTN